MEQDQNLSIYNSSIKIPASLDLENVTADFIKSTRLKIPLQRAKDSIALIFYHVHVKHQKMIRKGKISKEGFVTWHVSHRREMLGRDQDIYFNFLLERQYLLSIDYKINVKSTGYKINMHGNNHSFISYHVTDTIILRRLAVINAKSNDLNDALNLKSFSVQQVFDLPIVSVHPDVYVDAPIKLTMSGRSKLTTFFAGEDYKFSYVSGK